MRSPTQSNRASERQPPRQITVVRPGALGDTLLTLPALALLRNWAPDARLTFIARAEIGSLTLANGLADQVWPWESPDWSVLFGATPSPALTERAQAALAHADVVIVWAADPDGAIIQRLRDLGVARPIVAPAQAPSDDTTTHTALWLAETLHPLGIATPASREELTHLAPLRAPAEERALADALWNDLRLPRRVVALHPGSGSQAKRWPAERFAEVARLASDAGYQPLLLAGDADAQALAETSAALARWSVEAPLARGLRVATLAALLARCAGYVGCDSGVSHLAGLVGAPTVAVFGPTDPARWTPLGPRAQSIRADDGRLDHVEADAVWALLRSLLRSLLPDETRA